MSNPHISSYFRSLNYDPKSLLSVQIDHNTESLPSKDRQAKGNAVIICTRKEHSLRKNLGDVTILRPTGGVIFPGALIYADQNLMEGRPTSKYTASQILDWRGILEGMLSMSLKRDPPTKFIEFMAPR